MTILSSHYFKDERCLVMSLKWMPESTQFIEQTPQCPNITFLIIRFLFTQLRRKIEWSANHSLSKLIGSEHFGYSQISYFNFLIFVHKNIKGFNISMQYLVFMNVLKTSSDLNKESPYFVFLQRPFILQFKEVIQIAIITVLHYYVESIILNK